MSALSDLGTFLKGEREGVTLELDNKLNALSPYSGYLQVSKKLDNFYFKTGTDFIASMADKNRYVKFLDKVVDTYGPELGNFTEGNSTITQNNRKIEFITNAVNGTAKAVIEVNGLGKHYLVKYKVVESSSPIRRYWDGGYNVLSVGIEYEEILKSDGNTALEFLLLAPAGANAKISNISVREIQSINLSNYIPETIVQDEATNGLTLQSSVNAGDYVVVDRKELVTNGTFDSYTSGWTSTIGSGLSVLSGELVVTRAGGANNWAYQTLNVTAGVEYIITFSHRKGTGDYSYVRAGTEPGIGNYFTDAYNGTEMKKVSKKIVATSSVLVISLGGFDIDGTAFYDNVSVKRVDEVYRAKIDAPAGTSLTNTTYFEVRDSIGVTNQIGVFHKYNLLTNSYEGLSAEILFSDVSKEDLLDNSVWMARNGFSKVSQFLYSKGSYLVVLVGIWQSLNKGAYHPFLNWSGTCKIGNTTKTDRNLWYGTNAYKPTSLSGVIEYSQLFPASDGNVGGVSGNPDSKYYNIVYSDQVIDVREYAKILNQWEVDLIWRDKEENGVEEVVFTEQVTQTTTGTVVTLEVGNGANYKVGSVLQIWNGTTPYRRYVVSVSGNTVTLDSAIVKTAVPFIISGGKLPSLGSNTSLKVRLIGAPTNFPTIMTNRLAESKYMIGLGLQMVNDLGNNQLFDGIKDSFKLDDKFTSILQSVRSTNSGSAYTSFTATNSTITNALTLIDEPTANIVLVSMTAKNNPYAQTTPKAVIEVLPKVQASNSHSIYKGALVGNQVSGKIQVGNGVNGYESKVLENVLLDIEELPKGSFTAIASNLYMVTKSGSANYYKGAVFKKSAVNGTTDWSVLTDTYWNTTTDWTFIGFGSINSTPSHSTIALDNANSPASKWFECLEEGSNGVLAGVYGQEVVYGADTGSFANLSNGTTIDFSNNTVRTFHGAIPLNGKIK